MTTTTRFLGNCQICEGDQKLLDGRMVHHGYRRPGHGHIVGDCPGVGEVPYEVSCDLIKSYKAGLENFLAEQEKRLDAIKSGQVTRFTRTQRVGSSWNRKLETIEYVLGVTEPHKFASALETLKWEVEGQIRQVKFDIERCARRIAAWKPMPIRTVEEEQRKNDEARAARKAERDAARAARLAKQAATKAKQEALAARRKAIREDFETKFRTLAAGSESLDARQHEARELLRELDKTKYRNWLGKWDLECEDAFVALGLATKEGVNGRGRPYLRWRF